MPRLQTFAKLTMLGASALLALTACGDKGTDKVARGKYLVAVISCGDCHTPGALMGKPDMARELAGSDVGFFVPDAGYFYGPNLTPDETTGLGKWSEDEIVTALRTGKRPDGRILSPSMPWNSFASLTDDDAHAIAAYLKSLAPISNKAPGPFGVSEAPTSPYETVTMPTGAPTAAPAAAAEPSPAEGPPADAAAAPQLNDAPPMPMLPPPAAAPAPPAPREPTH